LVGFVRLVNKELKTFALGAFDEIDVDHKIPFCYGGGNERGNIQLAHSACNRLKRAEVNPHDLLAYLEDQYMNLLPAN
jgi:hypothetical protein